MIALQTTTLVVAAWLIVSLPITFLIARQKNKSLPPDRQREIAERTVAQKVFGTKQQYREQLPRLLLTAAILAALVALGSRR